VHATESLNTDHRIIELALPALAHLGEEAAHGRLPGTSRVEPVLDFIRTFADAYHHGKEERHLFPALEARGIPRNEGLVLDLLKEHGQARRHERAMAQAVEGASKEGADGAREFGEHAREYVEWQHRHIETEDTQLWRLAEDAFWEDDDEELRAGYAEMEREVLGELGREGYRQRAEELAQRLPATERGPARAGRVRGRS
jgi:hemerythrin-like domain-containing protein